MGGARLRDEKSAKVIPIGTTFDLDAAVMARLRAPFTCELIENVDAMKSHWRIADANDDAIASVGGLEEGYARLIVEALNAHFAGKHGTPLGTRGER